MALDPRQGLTVSLRADYMATLTPSQRLNSRARRIKA